MPNDFNRIFTTNSYQEFEAEHEHVTLFIVI